MILFRKWLSLLFSDETTLGKRGWRTDRLWAHPLVFKSFLSRIALFSDTYALMRSQYWPRERLEKLRDERLVTLMHDAIRVPLWRDRFKKAGVVSESPAFTEMLKLPPISKKDLIGKDLNYATDMALLKWSDGDHTSGSTGLPLFFHLDWHSSLRSYAVTERIFRTSTGDKRFPIVYMRARERNGFTFYKHIWFFLRGYRGIEHRMGEFKKLGERFPDGFVLYGYTSSVVEVARQMEKIGMKLPLRAVMVAGENLQNSDRLYMEKVMQASVYTLYASREAGFLGYECEKHSLHLAEEWAYVEIADENGNQLPTGSEGRILVTTFDNRVMPFIRYDIGDRGVISDEPCPCGRTLRTLTLKGRTAELIELPDNRVVSLLDISTTLDMFWIVVRQFQVVQTGRNAFTFRVVPGPKFSAKKRLEASLVRLLHPNVEITWDVVDSIPAAKSGKAVYFVREYKA